VGPQQRRRYAWGQISTANESNHGGATVSSAGIRFIAAGGTLASIELMSLKRVKCALSSALLSGWK
jgi:hypothetical protein